MQSTRVGGGACRPHKPAWLLVASALLGSSGCILSDFEIDYGYSTGGAAGQGGTAGMGSAGMSGGGSGGSAGGTSRISPPRLAADRYIMLQGTSLDRDASVGLLANDSPVNLRVNGFSNLEPSRPRSFDADLMVAPDGSFHFVPPPRFFGSYRFTYTVENLVGQTASESVEIRVLPTQIDLDAIIQGIGGFVLYGASGEGLGTVLDRAFDVNADGRADILLGAPGANAGDGAAFVVFGKDDLDSVDVEPRAPGTRERRYASVTGGSGEGLGASVAGLGDLDGDGAADIAIGASSGAGRAYFVFATELNPANSVPFSRGFSIEGDPANVAVANVLRGGGDVDADGVPDVLLSAVNGDFGWLHVPFGDGTLQGELGLTEAPGAHVRGAQASDGFVRDAAFVGDLDGDGTDEVLAASDGAFYLFRGGAALPSDASATSVSGSRAGYRVARVVPGAASVSGIGDINADGSPDLAYCDPARCAVVQGPISTLGQATLVGGFRRKTRHVLVRGGGDVDGDGLADMLFADDQRAYLVYGDRAGVQPLDVSALGSRGFSVSAAAGGSVTAIAILGDVNRDGLADIAISDASADDNAGRVYVVFGIASR